MTFILRQIVAGFIRLYTGVHGIPPNVLPELPFVVIANHSSHLDTMVIWAAVPSGIRSRLRPAGAADYWLATPLRRWFFSTILSGMAIERQHVSRANNPIDDLAETLRSGNGVLIFPEGTRSRDGSLQPFKSGVYHLVRAMEQPTPVLPIGLQNLQRIMPKGEVLPIPLLCTLRLGETIFLDPDESKEMFLNRCQSAIQRLITRRTDATE